MNLCDNENVHSSPRRESRSDLEQAANAGQNDALTVLLPRFEAEMVLLHRFLADLEGRPAAQAATRAPPR